LLYCLFLVYTFYGIKLHAEESVLTATDTNIVNTILRNGRSLHFSRPDSAIYYYHIIFNNFKLDAELINDKIPEINKAYIETVIQALNYTGNIYYYKDEYNRAEIYYQRSLDLALKAGFSEFVGLAMFDIGYIRYVNNSYSEAKKLFEGAYMNYYKTDDNPGMYDALNACGLTNRRQGNYQSADSCYLLAFEIANALGDSLMISDVKINLGILLCEQGELEDGISLFEEALDYYEKADNERAVSTALLNIGVVMKMVKEYDKALSYIKKSTEIEELSQTKSQLVIRYYNLADLYLDMGENDKAYDFCQKIHAVANEIASRPFIAECNFLLGKYFFIENNNIKAKEHFKIAFDTARNTNNKPLIANINLWRAKTYLQDNDLKKAIKLSLEAYQYTREMNLILLQEEISYVLFESYEKSGRLRDALKWHKIFHSLSDSIRYFNQQKEIKRIEARYNYEKKEKENELLRNKVSLQEQKLKTRNITSVALIIGILLSIIVILLLSRRMKDAKILYRQRQMLNLRELEDIHKELDGKKRELTSKMMFLNQKNELIKRIIDELKEIQNSPDISFDELSSIVNELRIDAPQSNWKEFEMQFTQVHPDFYKRLFEKHPGLSSQEQRICAFLRMNLNTKEIAAITGRSFKSIEVTRSRIRTKLKLSRKDNLSSFLASI